MPRQRRRAPQRSSSFQAAWKLPTRALGRMDLTTPRISRAQSTRTETRQSSHFVGAWRRIHWAFAGDGGARHLHGRPGLEGRQAAVAEAGLDEDRVRVLELGVPVQVVHPDAIQVVGLEQRAQVRDAGGAEPAVGGADAHEPGGLGRGFSGVVDGVGVGVRGEAVAGVQGGELGEHLRAFGPRAFQHRGVEALVVHEDRVDPVFVEPGAPVPERLGGGVGAADQDALGRLGSCERADRKQDRCHDNRARAVHAAW